MKFDLQDALLVIAVLCIEGGVAAIYRPVGLILLGLFALYAALRLEKAKAKKD